MLPGARCISKPGHVGPKHGLQPFDKQWMLDWFTSFVYGDVSVRQAQQELRDSLECVGLGETSATTI